ncbi:MAG: UDP-N-acetylglucosamine 1-carboxyvinyltransferase [Ruminococcus sp.]|jgi:UDP-N-acetylglucosamine 1-carboxyvinyltransferase|nr:UDP-N-acetylglucosamine 1-carboxyvinyltransferase [Ruminococcus sp.]
MQKLQRFKLTGGHKLSGEIVSQGAKNAVLPILAAAVLIDGEAVIDDVPELSDTYSAVRILSHLGVKVNYCKSGKTASVNASQISSHEIPDDMMKEMRSSIFFLGPIIGRTGSCRLSYPGGCDIGLRPIDMHISALEQMGVKVTHTHEHLYFSADKGLRGAKIALRFPSVGTTENIICAAVTAKGETVITNAAREPEVVDLVKFLNTAGAKIKFESGGRIIIDGVSKLHGLHHTVMPDRIAAATILAGTAAAGGLVTVKNCQPLDMEAILPLFEAMGSSIYQGKDFITINSGKRPKALPEKLTTMVYPGFPTDAQSVIMGALCKASGTSIIEETIFENRYRHVPEMQKMGADIVVSGQTAVIKGVKRLHGAKVKATDLRGGAGMVIAGLTAEGITEIEDIRFIDRGYEQLELIFSSLGADIKRI